MYLPSLCAGEMKYCDIFAQTGRPLSLLLVSSPWGGGGFVPRNIRGVFKKKVNFQISGYVHSIFEFFFYYSGTHVSNIY